MKLPTSTLASGSKNLGAGLVTFKHESATTVETNERLIHTLEILKFVDSGIKTQSAELLVAECKKLHKLINLKKHQTEL